MRPDSAELTEREQAALELIVERGSLPQSELWKELEVSSRTGSRIVSSLVEAGVIEREEMVYDGRVTYELIPVMDPMDLDFSLLLAGGELPPFIGDEDDAGFDPQGTNFSQWVLALQEDAARSPSPDQQGQEVMQRQKEAKASDSPQ